MDQTEKPSTENVSPETEPSSAQSPETAPESAQPQPALPIKKSHGKLFAFGGILAAIVVVAIAGLLLYHPKQQHNSLTPTQDTKTSDQTSSVQQVDSMTSTLTSGTTDEGTITNTDDSSQADDMNKSAANVGDNVDENNF